MLPLTKVMEAVFPVDYATRSDVTLSDKFLKCSICEQTGLYLLDTPALRFLGPVVALHCSFPHDDHPCVVRGEHLIS